jgi:hypothetical protein
VAREDSTRIGTARAQSDSEPPISSPRLTPPMIDEGKVAHAWLVRVAAIVGIVASVGAAGFSVASFLARFATQEELVAVREQHQTTAERLGQRRPSIEAQTGRLTALEAAQNALMTRQQHLDEKIDWLIQVQLLTASRSRVSLPPPPRYSSDR